MLLYHKAKKTVHRRDFKDEVKKSIIGSEPKEKSVQKRG